MTSPDTRQALPPLDFGHRPRYAGAADKWTLSAACLNADPELFFPDLFGAIGAHRTLQAKRFCAGCPVRAKCLEWAIGSGEAYGIWGGMTPDERRLMRARSRR